ncbi:MAG: sulfotransferase [Planctomycetota bacterium]
MSSAPTTPPEQASSRRPILLLGVMNRCGTNHLAWLLGQHPDVHAAQAGRSGEDYLLKRADLLADYAADTVRHWSDDHREAMADRVLAAMGDGLLGVIRGDVADGQRLLLRTPRLFAIDQAARLFPAARMVLLMRDGREVVASAEKTFSALPAGEWERRWSDGAKRLWDVTGGQDAGDAPLPWQLVRFESLVADPRGTIERLLDGLALDRATYPWAALTSAPLIGSSTAMPAADAAQPRWTPMAKPADFKPKGRWHDWSPARRRRFDRLCGAAMARWGYGAAAEARPGWWGWGRGRRAA